jgi:hypothetical protein
LIKIYDTFFSFFFISALLSLSFQLVWKSSFLKFILIFSSSSRKVNCITCARHDTRSIFLTLKSTSSNVLVRNMRSNFLCIVLLLSTLSFVITSIRSCNLCREIISCIIFASLDSICDSEYAQTSTIVHDNFNYRRWSKRLQQNILND